MFSKELYEDIKVSNDFNFFYQRKGLLMCYQTEKAGAEEWNTGQRAIKEGLKVENLTKEQVLTIEPNAGLNVNGAVYYHSDAHMTPNEFMSQMKVYLQNNGVSILNNEEVLEITVSNHKISEVKTNNLQIKSDEFVIASGAWSQKLMKKLNTKIPVQAGKGYRINVAQETGIKIPSILIEAKVAVTPMNGFTRFAGTMEVDKINNKVNPIRVNAIAKAAEKYYNGLKILQPDIDNAACGLRPCSPDGLPYIGRLSKIHNVTVATGHAMMGWSLGPATGKLVSEIISDKRTSLNLHPFFVERFS
ncbi:NAD(P)/FAD-dependent oxidoreductase [Polaribacter ponticola]|uniref:NAD(P)/FAD-dependent oxidoreductase n=1 Tax=Polaribacter ponticola TaxID=2978475 RepID=UPI0030823432